MTMTHEQYLEGLIADFQRGLMGRPVATLEEAAMLTRYGARALKDAIDRGELKCSRQTEKAQILITCRRLAEWIARGERNSLPKPDTKPFEELQEIERRKRAASA